MVGVKSWTDALAVEPPTDKNKSVIVVNSFFRDVLEDVEQWQLIKGAIDIQIVWKKSPVRCQVLRWLIFTSNALASSNAFLIDEVVKEVVLM